MSGLLEIVLLLPFMTLAIVHDLILNLIDLVLPPHLRFRYFVKCLNAHVMSTSPLMSGICRLVRQAKANSKPTSNLECRNQQILTSITLTTLSPTNDNRKDGRR